MSATNWAECPKCIERAEKMCAAFSEKYYGKLDAEIFIKILDEVKRATDHMSSYDSDEFKPNAEIRELMDKHEIIVEVNGKEYDPWSILQTNQCGTSLREDYHCGVNSQGFIKIYYGCSCDQCGFDKDFKYEEEKRE